MQTQEPQASLSQAELAAIEVNVHKALIDKLYGHSILGIIGGLGAASILYYLFTTYHQTNEKVLSVWYVILSFFYCILLILYGVYKILRPSKRNIKTWSIIYNSLLLIFGIAWGGVSIFIMPKDVVYQAVTIIVLFGIAAAFAQGTTGNSKIGITTVLLIIIPIMIWCLWQDTVIIKYISIIALLFIIFLLFSAFINAQTLRNTFYYNFVNIALSKKLAHQAAHDDLTGLANRAMLYESFSHSVSRAQRDKKMLAVVFLDLDDFKKINDNFGHEAGDELLIYVAKQLQSLLRGYDIVARLGGDEFVLLLEGIESKQQIILLIERIFECFLAPFQWQEHFISIAISIGVSCYPQQGVTIQALLKQADKAMYAAKKNGKNHYRIVD